MNQPHFVYREAKDQMKLFQLLQIRYHGYRACHLKGFCPENEFGIDLDKYDPYSHHMGLFQVVEGNETAIGYMRVVQEEEAPMAKVIRKIAANCSPEMLARVNEERMVAFPAMEYFPGAEKLSEVTGGYQMQGRKLGEASRFIIDPSYRSLRLALFMIECVLSGYMFAKDFTHSTISCSIESHARIYQSYGFQEFEDIKKERLEQCASHSFSLLLLKKEAIPQKIAIKLRNMADAFEQHNAIYFHPERKDHFLPFRTILQPTHSIQVKNVA